MEKIKITINGNEIETVSGKTVLEVARENGIDTIPTLCHDPRIEPYGSCFLCVVQVEGLNKLVPSCATPVNDGMVVHTDSDEISASRKMALDFLLSNHYADCIGPCKDSCPAGVDAQGYIALISMGYYEEALKLIKNNNPLPLSIGRVCVRNCEDSCRREITDDPVAINFLKRYVADIDADDMWTPDVAEPKGKSVAVIGGGPSGLTCAYYLTLKGYKVTIFEKLPELGGMLRYGIPEYRLPKEILDAEIKWITDLGVDVRTSMEMGKDFSIDSLKANGFDCIYIAVGAHKASAMRLSGEDETEGILKGIDFLRTLQDDNIPSLNGTVVIVGGGNTAIDAARTALRCGADSVKMVYRRSRKEMPAHEAEIEAALEEGIDILYLTNPCGIKRDGNKLKGIECLKMELKEAAPGERPRPVPVEGSEFFLPCNYLIGAIGQQVDTSFNKGETVCELERWGTILANDKTFMTSVEGVFAGGDVVTGPWTAIGSIAHGKDAADSIDTWLMRGEKFVPPHKFYSFKHKFADVGADELSPCGGARVKMPELSPDSRTGTFDEVELGVTPSEADEETIRCLECGCSEYWDCDLRKYADEYGADVTPFIGETKSYPVDNNHPFIIMDPNKCINCGRCVRTCGEQLEISALGFAHRGLKAIVRPSLEKSLPESPCISCGNCIDTCPTGALSETFPFKTIGTLPKIDKESVCSFCSIGCTVNYKKSTGDTFYVSNSTESVKADLNKGYLCSKGRFGYRIYNQYDRLLSPLKGGQNSTWDEAVISAAEGLRALQEKYGKDSVALFVSPSLTNESMYLAQKMAREVMGTDNVASLEYLVNSSLVRRSTATFADLKEADVVIYAGTPYSEEDLVLGVIFKELSVRGAVTAHITTESALMGTDIHWDTERPEVRDFEDIIKESGIDNPNVVVLVPQNYAFMDIVTDYLLKYDKYSTPGSGMVVLGRSMNSAGIIELGITPSLMPGLVKSDSEVNIYKELTSGKIKGALILGENPCSNNELIDLFGKMEFIVTADVCRTVTSEMSDVALPLAAPVEEEGTCFSADNRVRRLKKMIDPVGGMGNIEIISALSRAMGTEFLYDSPEDVEKEIAEVFNKSGRDDTAVKDSGAICTSVIEFDSLISTQEYLFDKNFRGLIEK